MKKLIVLSAALATSFTFANTCAPEVLKRVFSTGFLNMPLQLSASGEAEQFLEKFFEAKTGDGLAAGLIVLSDPSPKDIETAIAVPGVLLSPAYIDWNRPTTTFQDHINGRDDLTTREKKKRISDYERKLRKTEAFTCGVSPLTEENFAEWRPLFRDWVLTKEAGLDVAPESYATDLRNAGKLGNFKLISIRDASGKLVGGSILEHNPSTDILAVRRAAFDKSGELEKTPLAIRAYEELIQTALREKIGNISYGADSAFYGDILTPGMQRFKASLGFAASPSQLISTNRLLAVGDRSRLPDVFMVVAYKDGNPNGPLQMHVFGQLPADHAYPPGMEVIQH